MLTSSFAAVGYTPHPGDGRAQTAGKRYLALADGPTITFLEMAQILDWNRAGHESDQNGRRERIVRSRRDSPFVEA